MRAIIQSKFRIFLRKPWLFIIMTVVCIMFAFFIGKNTYSKITVPIHTNLPQEEYDVLLKKLNESDLFIFEQRSSKEVRNDVKNGNAEAGLHIEGEEVTLIANAETGNVPLLNQYVQTVYTEYLQKKELLNTVEAQDEKDKLEEVWDTALTNPIFTVEQENFRNKESKVIDTQLQGIFGFSLFFVIYTIAFNVIHILEEKEDRIWNRMIVSSVKKWEIYAGNLIYSFLMGYVQVVLVFITFHFGAGVDFYGGFVKTLIILIPYVLAIVSLCMLLAGISKTTRQFNALVPLFSVSLAMLGGAYWPIEIVSSDFMLMLSNISPLLYGMEALKGATIFNYGYMELFKPISVLMLMAVVMMGFGINLMEKRT